jgi:DUF438 domain-containing protein
MAEVTGYDEMYDDMLIEHMKQGYSFSSFAKVVGFPVDEIREWAKVNPSFAQAREVGTAERRYFFETKLIQICEGKIRGANAMLLMFTLKNCFPDEWRDVIEHNENINLSVINEPEKLLKLCMDAKKWKEEQDAKRLPEAIDA